MKPIANILYLEFSDFPQKAQGYLKKVCCVSRNGNGNSYQNIPDPSDARRKLINYDTVPKATLEKYKIPTKQELITNHQHSTIANEILLDTKDLNFYLGIPKANPLASEYADIAAWCRWCANSASEYTKVMNLASVDETYTIAIGLMNRREWRTWKITNLRRFKDAIKPFRDASKGIITHNEALQTLISAKFGTNNAAKLLIETQAQNLLIQIYSDPKKPSFTQTYAIYKIQAEALVKNGTWNEKTLVTETTIENFLKRPEIAQSWYLARYGLQEWRRKYDHINKRIPASFANAKWVLDGTQFPLYYQEGNSAYARLNVFVVLDEHSWAVLGFMVSESENSDQVIKSMWMACKLNGTIPHQIQYDHGSAIMSVRTQEVIEKIAKYGTATEVGNARAKVVEPFWKQFFQRIARLEYGFAFSPVMGKTLDSAQNKEFLQVQIKAGLIPQGRNAAIDGLTNMLNAWNAHEFNGSSPIAKYRKSMEETKDVQRPFSHAMEVDAFYTMAGVWSKIKIIEKGKSKMATQFNATEYTYSNWGLRIEIDKVKHDFDLLNTSWWSRAIGEKFNVKYHPEQLGKMYLYQDGKPVESETGEPMYLEPKVALHSAIADHTEGEMKQIKEANNLRKEHKKGVIKRNKDTIELTKQDGTYTPVLLGNLYPKDIVNEAKALLNENWQQTEIPNVGAIPEPIPEPIIEPEPVEVEPILDRYGFPVY